ncbi:MAG: ORF6N domain-containing protein [Treponema sp.]|jgi:hypothetical protein|nr:ORF6N domain-containing protein [Treponema sp.]
MAKKSTQIQNLIYEIRGQKVMLDSDLAALYGVELRTLNQAVKRNIKRFPVDFMFQLSSDEWDSLRSQFATSNEGEPLRSQFVTSKKGDSLRSQFVISKSNRGGRRYAPYAFTEQGVSMLSSVINSERAIEVNINIMRTFVKLRHYVLSKSDTNEQITELRKLLMLYVEKNDKRVNEIIIVLNNLIKQPPKTKTIGFTA